MDNSLRIAVINGGDSAEAAISRISAQGVITALAQNYSVVESIEMDVGMTDALRHFRPDVVFPVLHGPPGEDGTLQGYLEMLGYAYVGSGVAASAIAMDKIKAKLVFAAAGLPLARQIVVLRSDGIAPAVNKIEQSLGHAVVVKPSNQGSALGVTLVNNDNELHDAVSAAFALNEEVLVEERITGREITVGVIDTDQGAMAFPVIEIITPENSWYDFEHRYTKGLSDHVMPADLDPAQSKRLQDIAIGAHQSLGCRDLSRADFIVADDAHEILLEVNTLPGMTPTSLYPDGAHGFGLEFPDLVSQMVERAASRR
jgi:D-alanine-D-alanine ligase